MFYSLSPEYGEAEVLAVAGHFQQTLKSAAKDFSTEEALNELRLMKKVLYKRHGTQLHSLTWK